MADQRWVRLSTDQATSTLYVLDTELSLDVRGSAPPGAKTFDVWGSPGVNLYIIHNGEVVKVPSCVPRWPLSTKVEVIVTMDGPSTNVDDEKVRILYYKENAKAAMAKANLLLTCIQVSLDADTTRTGSVTRRAKNKKKWTWGPNGSGAILLVNCDRDDPKAKDMDNADQRLQSFMDLKDMSLMILTTRGPEEIFEENHLLLRISASDSDKVRVFHAQGKKKLNQYKHVLGSGKISYLVERSNGQVETIFYVEGLAFPDVNFSGLVSLHATLLEATTKALPEAPMFNDTVVFRIAPWIMTPNTLQPISVYICSMQDNHDFVADVSKLAKKAGCQLIICPEVENHGDRWIQDEMEIGYIQAPHKTFPVVFDSPRNRELKDFPFKGVLGPDFGYVTREAKEKDVSGLDSFGNLEVSPPVTVKAKKYPLGRILIGSAVPSPSGKEMVRVVRDFLYAQRVQSPIELYSAWLLVGHVDEFVSFVPASDRKGFRLLLASPSACFKLLREKEQEGYGNALMFEGAKDKDKVSIKKILADKSLRNNNEYYQKCIDWNRDILKEELGLTEEDIIDIPQLFAPSYAIKAVAFFPDMVNMLVLGKHLAVPKPFGPILHDQCCLEEEVRRLLEPLGLSCTFIDDFQPYHLRYGEVHCGTNVRRKAFTFKWWNASP